jgi:hypothetical protein
MRAPAFIRQPCARQTPDTHCLFCSALLSVLTAAQAPTQFNKGEITRAKARLAKMTQSSAAASGQSLAHIKQQLQRALVRPQIVGATPSTPYAIAMRVAEELEKHSTLYRHIEHHARPLLQKWFEQHPTDMLQQRHREMICKIIRHNPQHLKEEDLRLMTRMHDAMLAMLENWDQAFQPAGLIVPKEAQQARDAHFVSAPAVPFFVSVAEDASDVASHGDGAQGTVGSLVEDMKQAHVAGDTDPLQLRDEVVDQQQQFEEQRAQLAAQQQQLAEQQRRMDEQRAQMLQQQQQQQQQQQRAQMMQQQASLMPPIIQPMAASSGVLLGAHNIPHPHINMPLFDGSPAPHALVQYGAVKAKFVPRIMQHQVEIDSLRAQVMRLSGVLPESDPRHQAIVREVRARFGKPAGPKMFDRRRAKLKKMRGELESMEETVTAMLQGVAELRLNCALYAAQVDIDNRQINYISEERTARVERWEEEEQRLQKQREDRIRRDQEAAARKRTPVTFANQYAAQFLPAHLQGFAAAATPPQQRGNAMEDNEIDDDDV